MKFFKIFDVIFGLKCRFYLRFELEELHTKKRNKNSNFIPFMLFCVPRAHTYEIPNEFFMKHDAVDYYDCYDTGYHWCSLGDLRLAVDKALLALYVHIRKSLRQAKCKNLQHARGSTLRAKLPAGVCPFPIPANANNS